MIIMTINVCIVLIIKKRMDCSKPRDNEGKRSKVKRKRRSNNTILVSTLRRRPRPRHRRMCSIPNWKYFDASEKFRYMRLIETFLK